MVFQPSRGTVVIRHKFKPVKLDSTMKNLILQTYSSVNEIDLEPDEELVSEISETVSMSATTELVSTD